MAVGAPSAAKIGTTVALAPIPIPMMSRQINRVSQEVEKPEPMGEATRKQAVMKMVPRRPNQLLRGSESQQPRTDAER